MKSLTSLKHLVQDSDFALMTSQLALRLTEFRGRVPSEGSEPDYFASAIIAAQNVSVKHRYHQDLRLYMEATLISNSRRMASPKPRLLVTEDYKFFKAFVRSSYAFKILKELVCTILQVEEGVDVRLAGEVIHGM